MLPIPPSSYRLTTEFGRQCCFSRVEEETHHGCTGRGVSEASAIRGMWRIEGSAQRSHPGGARCVMTQATHGALVAGTKMAGLAQQLISIYRNVWLVIYTHINCVYKTYGAIELKLKSYIWKLSLAVKSMLKAFFFLYI